ncbi:MAG TPA: ATP-dependent Clp protease adaptor ClpS, partial [Candidatus Nanopelagicales bacterium]|nr:ATP-dependent Clp protease adaptor ClpS [Candidatus Nanopelagicales bacterium]
MSTSSGEREDRHDGQVIRASQDGGQNGGQDGDQGGGQNGGQEGEERQGDLATERERKVDKPRRYKVLLHNDDYTTMDFVVLVLMKFFHRTETEATHIM